MLKPPKHNSVITVTDPFSKNYERKSYMMRPKNTIEANILRVWNHCRCFPDFTIFWAKNTR